MPTFSSAQVTDPFLSTNELLAPMKAYMEQQEGQQRVGMNDMSVVARAAAPLLGMSEADAAQAYPGIVADLQRQGFARQAPPTYPGHAVTQSLVQRGMTVPEQVQGGFVTAPGVTDALKAATAPLTSGNTGGGGTAASGGGGGSVGGPPEPGSPAGEVAKRTAAFWSGQGFTPEQVAGIMAGGPGAESGFNPGAVGDDGTSIGLYQHHADRMVAMKARYGPNPTEAQQHEFAAWEISPAGPLAAVGAQLKAAKTPEEAARIWTTGFENPANAETKAAARAAAAGRYLGYGTAGPRVATAPPPPFNPNAGPRVAGAPPAGAPGPAATPGFGPLTPVPGAPTVTGQADVPAPVTPSPVALRTGGTDVAGPGAGPDTTLPPVAQPNQLYQTGLPGVTISGPASNALAPPAAAAPAAPVAQVPAAVPAPPATRPATGQNSPQFQAALELNRRAQALDLVVDPTGRTKALAASLRAQAALYMQADSVTYDPKTGIGTKAITGERRGAIQRKICGLRRAKDAREEAEPRKRAGLPPGYRVDDPGSSLPHRRIAAGPTGRAGGERPMGSGVNGKRADSGECP